MFKCVFLSCVWVLEDHRCDFCLGLLPIVINTTSKSYWEQKHLLQVSIVQHLSLPCSNSSLREVRIGTQAGTWRQELSRGHGTVLLTDLLPVTFSVCFLYHPGSPVQGDTTQIQSLTKTMSPDLPMGQSDEGNSSVQIVSFQVCAMLTKASQHSLQK